MGKRRRPPTPPEALRGIVRPLEPGDPYIGREKEIHLVLQILLRRTKNNPVLVGDPGVGKTSLVQALVPRLSHVPPLADRHIFLVDVSALRARSRREGGLEGIVNTLLNWLEQEPRVLPFIDEIHVLYHLQDRGGVPVMDLLKPALARGLGLIGATTYREYRQFLAPDPALERRFQPVFLREPNEDETLDILRGVAPLYLRHHGMPENALPDETLSFIIQVTNRYLSGRHQPDKSLTLLDGLLAWLGLTHALEGGEVVERVTPEHVSRYLETHYGIPTEYTQRSIAERLRFFPRFAQEQGLVGQTAALWRIVEDLTYAFLRTPSGVRAALLFAGSSGAGKTMTARLLARFLTPHGGEYFHMTAWSQADSLPYFLGDPSRRHPGALTDAARRHPFNVIVFDEIERAHPHLLRALQGIMDAGWAQDEFGERVSFRNVVFVFVTGVPVTLGYEGDHHRFQNPQEVYSRLLSELPEPFLARIHSFIYFPPLSHDDLVQVLRWRIQSWRQAMNIATLRVSGEVLRHILETARTFAFGARHLERTVHQVLYPPLTKVPEAHRKRLHVYIENGRVVMAPHQETPSRGEDHGGPP